MAFTHNLGEAGIKPGAHRHGRDRLARDGSRAHSPSRTCTSTSR
jgi:hypothetical protein